jgi:hypothetical protein
VTIIYYDNVSFVYMTVNPVHHRRMKHIEIDIHFVCEKVSIRQVCVLHVPTSLQFVNIMTKGLPTKLFLDFWSSLCARDPPALTAGGGGRGVTDNAFTSINHRINRFILRIIIFPFVL